MIELLSSRVCVCVCCLCPVQIFGGAVAFIVSVPTYSNPTVALTVDSCVFQSCSAIAAINFGQLPCLHRTIVRRSAQ